MIELLRPRESIEKLSAILDFLRSARNSTDEDFHALFIDVLTLLFLAHIKVVRALNSDAWDDNVSRNKKDILLFLSGKSADNKEKINEKQLNCYVPWDNEINLPSFPTLIADAASYKIFKVLDELLISVLNSFSEWSLFAKQEIDCLCGELSLKPRKVCDEIMIRYILGKNNGLLLLEQLIGVRSSDTKHLKNHFSVEKLIKSDASIYLISRSSATLKVGKDKVLLEIVKVKSAEEFNIDEFERQMRLAADLLLNSVISDKGNRT